MEREDRSTAGELLRIAKRERALWGLVTRVFIFLLAACGFWIFMVGFSGASLDDSFAYLAIFTFLVGICLAWRRTIRLFSQGFAIESRNAKLTRGRSFYVNWFGR
jgi:hypothetical protein